MALPGPSNGEYRTPRWVKVFAGVVAALVLLVVLAMALGVGGNHGPWRHASGDMPKMSE